MASYLRAPPVVDCMAGILAGLRPEHGAIGRRLDVSQLAASFADLAVIVADSGRRGLPELLRLLATALRQRATDAESLSDAQVAHLVEWLEVGQAYCSGRLPASLTAALVERLQSVDWVPEIPGRMRDLIVQRLLASLSPPAISDEDMQPADHRLAATLDDSILLASNTTLDERTTETDVLLGSPCTASTQSASVATSPRDQDDESVRESVGSSAHNTPIWISEDELSLAAQAVIEQLMPLSQALFDANTVEQRGPLIEDLAYHTRLIGGALELLGLVALHRSTDIVLDEIDHLARRREGDLDSPLGLLLRWQVALLGFLQTAFDRDAQDLLLETLRESTWSCPLDDSVADDVAAEFANIAVGRDPDAKLHRVVYAGPDDVALTPASDVLPSVLDGMLSELPGNARQLSARLHAVSQNGDPDDVDVARRVAHTLKGDANTVGIRGIANLTHAIEDILGYLAKSSRSIEPGLADLLGEAADCVDAMADHVLGRGPAPEDALDILQRVSATAEALLEGRSMLGNETFDVEAVASKPADQAPEGPGHGRDVTDAIGHTVAVKPSSEAPTATLQIPVGLLDELLRLSSETIVVARQVEEQLRTIGIVRSELQAEGAAARELVSHLDDLVALRGAALQSARLEKARDVDALELDQYNELHVVSRRLIETSGDTGEHLQSLERALSTVSDLSAQQDRLQEDLQRAIMGTRAVPVDHQVPRFQRVVRQTARTLLKKAELSVLGAETLVDSDILDGISEPLVHALRNAVDHGIESPDERFSAGKAETGNILLEVERRGSDIVFRLTDDGRGLDYASIHAKALELGVLLPGASPTEMELARLILLPGFSTRDEATQVSGRGIGMDVVYRRVNELRGTLTLHSFAGAGTCLEMTLPANLVSAHVGLARSSGGPVAVATNGITQFVPIAMSDVERNEKGSWYTLEGERIPVIDLDTLVGADAALGRQQEAAVGILVDDENGARHIVLTPGIDEMRSVIVKSFGPYVATVPGVRGATILGTGGVAPVVDLRKLLSDGGWQNIALNSSRAEPAAALQRIIVADDSLSVRRALSQLMTDAGFEVETARDGLEAVALVERAVPAAVLVDLEMPRMNGLEFTAYLRNHSATSSVPVIMITSRTSDRHQAMAIGAGVTCILGKPYSDDDLVALVRQHVEISA